MKLRNKANIGVILFFKLESLRHFEIGGPSQQHFKDMALKLETDNENI